MSETQEVKKVYGSIPHVEGPKPKTLTAKLCEVMAAVGYLQKKGNNEKQEYKYIREADVVAKMRDEFAKRNVFIFPTLLSHDRVKLSRVKYDKLEESYVTDIVMRWTFVDGDSGEERSCDIPGCSASPGDKGVYVAMTGSEKYLLMKSFLLPTGDDPEDDKNEENGSKEAQKTVSEQKTKDLQAKIRAQQQSKSGDLSKALQDSIAAVQTAKPDGKWCNKCGHQPCDCFNKAQVNPKDFVDSGREAFAAGVAHQKQGNGHSKPSLDEMLQAAKEADLFDEISGTLLEVKDMKTTPAQGNRPFKRLVIATDAWGEIKDMEVSSFDNLTLSDGHLWDNLIPFYINSPITILVEKRESKGKTYYNLRDIKKLGQKSWDQRLASIQNDAR